MDFTEIFRARTAVFSPDSRYVLTAMDNRIVVRLAETFQISQAWQIQPHPADGVTAGTANARSSTSESVQCAWSCDSRYILAAKSSLVHIFDLIDKDWKASIQTGAEGLVKALWAPDGRCILCFSEWGVGDCLSLPRPALDFHEWHWLQLRVTIWSLVTGKSTYIQYPKYSGRGEFHAVQDSDLVLSPPTSPITRVCIQRRFSILCSSRETQIPGYRGRL